MPCPWISLGLNPKPYILDPRTWTGTRLALLSGLDPQQSGKPGGFCTRSCLWLHVPNVPVNSGTRLLPCSPCQAVSHVRATSTACSWIIPAPK